MTDRARVPFALIGVLLLVTAGTVAVTNRGPTAREPAVDEALDGLAAESGTALRGAVREAAREAARQPVLERANTSVGRQLDPSQPFVDALKLRIYRHARDRLRRLDARRRGLAVAARLPPIETDADVGRAIDRVTLAPADSNGATLEVTVEGLRLEASRDGRVVGRATRDPTIAVRTPILHVHRRVERFERRLNAGVGQPGLATRLTAVLYPIAWARGYAQFAGQPIENVVANRHLEVMTNGAVLGLQRANFGRADPLGRRVYARSLAETAVEDALQASNSSALDRLNRLRSTAKRVASAGKALDRLTPPAGAPGPAENMTVGINRTADIAYVRAIEHLNETLDRTYRPAVRVRADVSRLAHRSRREGRTDGRVIRSFTTTSTSVRNRTGTPLRPRSGWHELFGYSRTVTVTHRTITVWDRPGNGTGSSRRFERATYAVDLLVAGNHTVGPAPDGDIAGVHTLGGPFNGSNLADVRALVRAHVASRGGVDTLAERAATGELNTAPRRLQAERPVALAAWTRPDLIRLRREVRNISVEVERGRIATFEANVPRMLADRLRDRRAALIGAPRTYTSVAQRARVGVRVAYVDSVLDRLDAAARGHKRGRGRLASVLPDTDRSPAELLSAGRTASRLASPPGTAVRMRVDAAPSYLTLEAVEHGDVPAIPPGRTEHPLVARNVNAVTVPTDGIVEALFGLLEGPKTTSFRSAARVMQVAESTARGGPWASPPRAKLEGQLRKAVRGYRAWTASTLAEHELGTPAERADAVRSALGEWDSPAARAAAVSNGSAADAVLAEALDRWGGDLAPYEREVLEIDLATAADEARSADFYKPTHGVVNATANRVRGALGVAADRAKKRAKAAVKKRASALAARLPSGVPVIPAPGLWYAMANAWHVEVRGSYARFVVGVPRGAPDRLPADLRYVRENATVSLDVDGDGRAERLGHNRRISFEAETVIGVAVPPKPRGVGDVAERDEQSPGWPEPGTDGSAGK